MRLRHLERGFADEVLAESGGESFHACFSCGTCTAACPISWTDGDYNPRHILKLVTLGAKEEVLSSPAIWLCSACDICYQRCPQNVHLSDLMKAIRRVAIREGYEPTRSPAQANRRLCASCGQCVQACPYGAIQLTPVWMKGRRQIVVPEVDIALCQECGICTATCPVSAIDVPDASDQAILSQVEGFVNGNGVHQPKSRWKPTIVVFLCNWCLYSKLDQADVSRVKKQHGVHVVRIPCMGRMDPVHILTALQEGIDGVLVAGCQLGNCHYRRGNIMAENKTAVLRTVLQAAGKSERVRFAHISTTERGAFPRLVEEMRKDLKALGPISIR